MGAILIDSPGWGDTLSLKRNFKIVTNYITKTLRQQLKKETAIGRRMQPHHEIARHVDVVLYVFSPHRCKGIDMAFLKRLHKHVSIVPVLAKSDTMTEEELLKFRGEVTDALKQADIEVAHPPIAVVCAYPSSGRNYPWGVARSEDERHSELPKLRSFLMTDGLLKLKKESQQHYEEFRAKTLRGQN